MLADQYGYGHTFVMTAVLQGAACILWVPLLGIVAEEATLVQGSSKTAETEPLVNWHVEDDGGRRLSITSLNRQ